MDERNRKLQETFLFSNADVRANLAGALSARQQARLRSAAGGQRLALAVFVVVLAGTLAVLVFFSLLSRSPAAPNQRVGLLQVVIIAAVVGGVAILGLLISRPYMVNAAPRQMMMAYGPAQAGKIRPDAARYEVKIGAAVLRFSTEEHQAAFEPGVAYRVFYLPGPVATVLSGLVVGTEADVQDDTSELISDHEPDAVMGLQSRARLTLIGLGILVLGIPLVGFAASWLPAGARLPVMAALLAASVAFAYWAMRQLNR